jgi:hypothetical protein
MPSHSFYSAETLSTVSAQEPIAAAGRDHCRRGCGVMLIPEGEGVQRWQVAGCTGRPQTLNFRMAFALRVLHMCLLPTGADVSFLGNDIAQMLGR